MEKDESIQRFTEIAESSSFPHREELLKGIANGEYSLASYSNRGLSSRHMLDIYRVRARILAAKIAKKEVSGEHATKMKSDMESFVRELEIASNDQVKSWRFFVNGSSSYVAFEGVISRKILGCFHVVDRRELSEDSWKELWGKV